MHANSVFVLPHPLNITTAECTLGMLRFFLWRALAITGEDFVTWVCRRSFGGTGPRSFGTVLGWVWLLGTCRYSMAWAGDVMLRMQLGEEAFLPRTLVRLWVERFVPIPLGFKALLVQEAKVTVGVRLMSSLENCCRLSAKRSSRHLQLLLANQNNTTAQISILCAVVVLPNLHQGIISKGPWT